MRLPKLIPPALLAVFCFAAPLWSAAPQKGKLDPQSIKQDFDKHLPKMASDNLGEREAAQKAWQEICIKASAPGNDAARAEATALMIQKLDPQTPNITRLWLLKQLQAIGHGDCVNAVAALLVDKDDQVRDGAARCLATNPSAEATSKLIAALPAASAKNKVALLNALGYRTDAAAVDAVAKELTAADTAVATAAARALGKMATPQAAKALAQVRGAAKGPVHLEICNAYLLCAEQLLAKGQTDTAAAIYRELDQQSEPRSVRLAAMHGVLKTSGDKAGERLLQMLGGKDVDAQNIAAGMIEEINAAALKAVAAGMDKLPADAQVKVLTALAARGDKSQVAVALTAAKDKNDSVKRAGLVALGRLGDASVVPLLLEVMKSSANLAPAARDSLAQVAGKDVNEQLIAALEKEKDAGLRGQLIGILESRRVIAAVPLLLSDVVGEDAGLRKRAMTALQKLAQPEQLPVMIKTVTKIKKGAERDEMERTIVAVCGKIVEADKRPEPVLAVYLESARADQAVLLALLGRLGGAKALVLIRSALAGSDTAMAGGAFEGICNWPEPSVSEDLLKLVQDAKEPARRVPAYKALVRVNSIPTAGTGPAKLAVLKKAMDHAQGNDDRKLVLQGLATVKEIETLRYVLPYLDNKELSHEACKTVVELAHSKTLRLPNQAEFVTALDRVIVLCQQTDKGLAERAKGYKQGN
jgi:HEAT repeat protein